MDVLMDWTSIVYYGDMASLAKFGYSRDHRPDKKQVTLGVAQLAPPVNVPVALTVEPGNVNDQEHFRRIYDQVRSVLNESSLIVFDKSANDKRNPENIVLDRNDYLTSKKLNSADNRGFGTFNENEWERRRRGRRQCCEADFSVSRQLILLLRDAEERASRLEAKEGGPPQEPGSGVRVSR